MTTSDTLRAYHTAFAEWLGARRAFSFWKGRVALYAILKGLGVGEGDEVILPGYTCVMAVNPIIYLGAKPVFVDIEPRTFNLDPNRVEAAITSRTRVVIAQHTYGYPVDMAAIMDVAARKGLQVVEDCCLSLGSTYRGRRTGTFGAAAYFSFQWNKPYTSGLGGMAAVHDEALASRMEAICEREMTPPSAREVMMLRLQLGVYRTLIYPRTTALAQNTFRWLTKKGFVVGSSTASEFEPHMEAGFFKGMSALQAASGLRQLQKIDRIIAHRKHMVGIYDRLLSERGWPIVGASAEMDPVLVRYPVRVSDKDRALADAAAHFVELGSWFECPLHPIETPLAAYGYTPGLCPEAERACREVVNLPVHPRADEQTAARTVEFISRIGPPRLAQ